MKRTENRCARKERRRSVRDVGRFVLTHLGADPAKEVVGYGKSAVIGQSGVISRRNLSGTAELSSSQVFEMRAFCFLCANTAYFKLKIINIAKLQGLRKEVNI